MSTAIENYEYDQQRRQLRITFVNGRTYVYEGVPPEEFEAFETAGSLGRHFNLNIRDRYPFHEAL